jgi:type I restriction enzyme, S subunit
MNLTAQSLKDEFLGRVCLTSEGERCLLNQRLARLTPCGFPTAFALIVFKSRWFRTFVDRLNTGSLIQHMFTSQLESFPFPLPPLVEQRRIVAEVDRRLSIIREVEAEVDANLKRAQALRQAVLSKAFGVTQ